MKDRLIPFIMKIQNQSPEAKALFQVSGSGLFCVLGVDLEERISVLKKRAAHTKCDSKGLGIPNMQASGRK